MQKENKNISEKVAFEAGRAAGRKAAQKAGETLRNGWKAVWATDAVKGTLKAAAKSAAIGAVMAGALYFAGVTATYAIPFAVVSGANLALAIVSALVKTYGGGAYDKIKAAAQAVWNFFTNLFKRGEGGEAAAAPAV